MTVESDLDRQSMICDFGESIILNPSTNPVCITAIFDMEPEIYGDDLELSGPIPKITCRTLDVQDIVQGDTIQVRSVDYMVRVNEPDGTGISILELKK